MPLARLLARTRAFVRHWGLRGAVARVAAILRQQGWAGLGERLAHALTGRVGLIAPIPPFAPARHLAEGRRAAATWYARHAVPVTIVIPGARNDAAIAAAARRLQQTATPHPVTIVAVDGDDGLARAWNRGLAQVPAGRDAVLLDSAALTGEDWLAPLQHAAHTGAGGIAVPKLFDATGRIESAGSHRDLAAPLGFDQLYRAEDRHFPPSLQPHGVLSGSGACLYLSAAAIARLGPLDETGPPGFEAIDYCLRAWQHGVPVRYQPFAELRREAAAPTRPAAPSKALDDFWSRNGGFFARDVGRSATREARVIYVMQDLGIGGGHRVVFRHANTLAAAGFEVELWNLQRPRPDWHALDTRVAVRRFASYAKLTAALDGERAIKVATWWETAEPVWLGSVRNGVPVYLVQDIESSYYADDPARAMAALASYRPEFNYLVTGEWIGTELASRFGFPSVNVRLGYDPATFHARRARADAGAARKLVLVAARAEPLKNFAYARAILIELARHGYAAQAFGSDPSLVAGLPGCRFHRDPSDEALATLYAAAAVYLSTSSHEGFCLPPIEGMACGTVVAMTDAGGNRDYMEDGANCLVLPNGDAAASARKIVDALNDPALVETLIANGHRTAARYAWPESDRRVVRAFTGIARQPIYGVPLTDARASAAASGEMMAPVRGGRS